MHKGEYGRVAYNAIMMAAVAKAEEILDSGKPPENIGETTEERIKKREDCEIQLNRMIIKYGSH